MLSGISIWQLLIILLIVLVLFGGKKLRNMGSDLGDLDACNHYKSTVFNFAEHRQPDQYGLITQTAGTHIPHYAYVLLRPTSHPF